MTKNQVVEINEWLKTKNNPAMDGKHVSVLPLVISEDGFVDLRFACYESKTPDNPTPPIKAEYKLITIPINQDK